MRLSLTSATVAVSGFAALLIGFFSTAGAQDRAEIDFNRGPRAEAVFAGGCFWCVEADFDKLEGVIDTTSGYTGGTLTNPTYKDVSYKDTGHVEAVRVTYDPSVVSYEELVEYYFRHIDPTDDEGQFCDKGPSYKSAIFVANSEQRAAAEAERTEIDESGRFAEPVATKIKSLGVFWPAEDYHQDYYMKEPTRYQIYRTACGRDRKLEKVWGRDVTG